jgi:putative sigma-54 modulation protein
MEALDSIEEYARHRIEKIEKYSLKKDVQLHFIFEAKKGAQKAEILLNAGAIHMEAEAEEEDLYSAIDKAVHRLEKQLLKNKEKIQEHHHKS